MNMIYDVVFNFNGCEFFEWSCKDTLTYIEQVPAIKVDDTILKDLIQYDISIDREFLKKIYNQTIAMNQVIPYCVLFIGNSKALGVEFDAFGDVLHKSNLLLDEEVAVIDESESFLVENINYQKKKKLNMSFLTRREKKIQKRLISEIQRLFQEHASDEIHFLYQELFVGRKTLEEEYKSLIHIILEDYQSSYEELIHIIELAKN